MSNSSNRTVKVLKYLICIATYLRCFASKNEGSQFSLDIFDGIYNDMFEQSLYDHEAFAAVPESHEGELFHNYELRTWNLTPRIYKILGVSALINLLFLGVVSQTDLLTRKGCDSPFTATVCQVIDAAYVANTLFGTKREYVDEVYEKTELKDADVTFVDVSGETPPLEYPEGYFALANPNDPSNMFQQMANPDGSYVAPGFPPIPNQNDLLNSKPDIPKANPNAVIGSIPSDPLGDSNDNMTVGINKKRRGGQRFPGVSAANNSNTPAANTMANANTNPATNSNSATTVNPAQPPDEAVADQFGHFINKRPLKDQAKDTLTQLSTTPLKLDDNFKIAIAATLGLDADGKRIVLKDPKLLPVEKNIRNNPELAKLAQTWVLRIGDSGYFGYLDALGSKKVNARHVVITVEQNDTDFKVNVRTQLASEDEARSAASGLNAILGLAIPTAKGDEQTFLRAASPTNDGNSLILNVNFKKEDVQGLIQRKLAEATSPANQPSSTAINKPTGNNQSK